jgi:LmbE family N-acetylglucosaminyl deacetylase
MTVSAPTFPLRAELHRGLRLQVVVAHPDDETFGCGSLLLHAADAGVATAVCCASRGEAGVVREGVEVPDGGVGVLREKELRAAAEALGVHRVEVLGLRDSGMDGEAGPGTIAGAPATELRSAVRRSVVAFAPDVLVTLDASDGHRDHACVRDATVAVGAELGIDVWLHCLSRRLMRAWAQEMARQDPGSSYLAVGELGTPDDEFAVRIDTSAHLRRREQAIALHRSQVSPFEVLPPGLRREFLTLEHLAGPAGATQPATREEAP